MRILHTADWHLGHTLHGHSRQREHERFLAWLTGAVVEHEVDAILLAGDVFDSANPPPAAWRLWFGFLAELSRVRPALQVVVIAGNHDSAALLAAPRELLGRSGVHVVGRVEREPEGGLEADDLLIPLRGAGGEVEALCAAIPFLRASDASAALRGAEADVEGDPLVEGMRCLHAEVFDAARRRLGPGQALVAMGHGYLVGGRLSELSERKVLGGNQHALPVDLFPGDCSYVALGHLHRAQSIGGREHVCYSGAPLPLAMPERGYPHRVVLVDLVGGGLRAQRSLRVPLEVPMLRIPASGELEPEEALAAVAELPARDREADEGLRPLLEVAVRLIEPAPNLGEEIARLCADRNVRFCRMATSRSGRPDGSCDEEPRELTDLSPEEVFRRRYAEEHEGDVPPRLLDAFRKLLEEVEHAEEEA